MTFYNNKAAKKINFVNELAEFDKEVNEKASQRSQLKVREREVKE